MKEFMRRHHGVFLEGLLYCRIGTIIVCSLNLSFANRTATTNLTCRGTTQTQLRTMIWSGVLRTHRGPQHRDRLFYRCPVSEAQRPKLVRWKPPLIQFPGGTSPPSTLGHRRSPWGALASVTPQPPRKPWFPLRTPARSRMVWVEVWGLPLPAPPPTEVRLLDPEVCQRSRWRAVQHVGQPVRAFPISRRPNLRCPMVSAPLSPLPPPPPLSCGIPAWPLPPACMTPPPRPGLCCLPLRGPPSMLLLRSLPPPRLTSLTPHTPCLVGRRTPSLLVLALRVLIVLVI